MAGDGRKDRLEHAGVELDVGERGTGQTQINYCRLELETRDCRSGIHHHRHIRYQHARAVAAARFCWSNLKLIPGLHVKGRERDANVAIYSVVQKKFPPV